MGDKCYMNTDDFYTTIASNEIVQFSCIFIFFLLLYNIYTDVFAFSILPLR